MPSRSLGATACASVATVVLLVPSMALASGDGGHDHLTLSGLLHNAEFWGAVVNFSLLVFLIRRLAKQPLRNHLNERQRRVEQGMAEAAALKAKAEAVYSEYNERLKTMDADMQQLREDIEQAAAADKERILSEAKQESARLRAEAEALIAQHREALAQQVRHDVVRAAVAAAEEVLRAQATQQDQARLASAYKDSISSRGDRT